MTLRLPEALAAEIRRAGEAAYPTEGCGVLAGRVDSPIAGGPDGGGSPAGDYPRDGADAKLVVRLVPMVNHRTDDPHRYLMTADDLRRVEADLRRDGLDIVGYYHSHPDHPAAPSAFDTEHAWPWYSYVIVRVDRGRGAELASWVLDDDRAAMRPETVEVFHEVRGV